MKKLRLYFVLALCMVASANLSAITVTISGTVTNISGGTPISHHMVEVQDTMSGTWFYYNSVYTDTTGFYSFSIPNVPPNTLFGVSTLDCNYNLHSLIVDGNLGNLSGIDFQICYNAPTLTVNISGTLTSTENGSPVPNHAVQIHDSLGGAYTFDSTVITNSSGYYSAVIHSVPSGIWFKVNTLDCNNANHVQYLYGDNTPLTANFTICTGAPPTITVSISGTVTDIANGSPVPNHTVGVYSDSNSSGYYYVNFLTTNSSGNYSVSIPNVPQGITFTVYVYDCNWIIHSQDVNGDNTPITVNFQICTGNQTLFPLFGTVYAGNDRLDKGIVQLIRIDSLNNAYVYDTWYVQDTSHFQFDNVPVGNYYLKAIPSDSSIYYELYAPTYYDTTLYWNTAIVVNPQNQGWYEIHLVPFNSCNSGSGGINGTINQNSKTSTPMPNVEVLLLDQNSHPLTCTFTEGNGAYSFQNLAFGTYIVYPEIPKITTIPYTVNLDASNQNETVNFIIDNGIIYTGIKETPIPEISGISEVFPNPSSGQARISITSLKEMPVTMNILNSTGQVVNSQTVKLQKAGNTVSLAVSDLPDGFYYLRIQAPGGSSMKKFIISK